MNETAQASDIRDDDELQSLLSLQLVEAQEDDPLVQMYSCSSCLSGSCS